MEESRHKDKKSAPDTWYCLWLWWFSMDNGGSSWKWLMWKKYQLCNQYWMVKHKIWCVRPWRDQVKFIHIAHKKIEMWTNTWQWTEWLVFHWCSCQFSEFLLFSFSVCFYRCGECHIFITFVFIDKGVSEVSRYFVFYEEKVKLKWFWSSQVQSTKKPWVGSC